MRLFVDAISDVGSHRPNNEDTILIGHQLLRDSACTIEVDVSANMRFAAAVADGMGGHSGGEYASLLTLTMLDEFVAGLPRGLDDAALGQRVSGWVKGAHDAINEGGSNPQMWQMGTTVCGCFVYERRLYWLNVGDSRIYIYRDGTLRQISTDHTLRNLMHDSNIPTNVIYNCIGGGCDDIFADFDRLPIYDGDMLLICSDGLSDMLGDDDLSDALSRSLPAAHYIAKANDAGGNDNISLILIRVKI